MANLKNKLKAGDEVIVTTGKHKGLRGTLVRVLLKSYKNGKKRWMVFVDGITRKKHVRANPNVGIEGGIKDVAYMIDASNVAIVNPDTNAVDRIGVRTNEDGVKVRFYKKTGKDIEERGDQ